MWGGNIIWNGKEFVGYDGDVLLYPMPNVPTGWQDDLTIFHEEVTDGGHPIDMASLDKTLENITKYCSASQKHKGRILEIGCSSGLLLRRLHGMFPKAEIVGGDIIEKTLRKLSKALKQEGVFIPLFEEFI